MIADGLWKSRREGGHRDSEAVSRSPGALFGARGASRRSQIQEDPSVDPVSMKPTTQGPLA